MLTSCEILLFWKAVALCLWESLPCTSQKAVYTIVYRDKQEEAWCCTSLSATLCAACPSALNARVVSCACWCMQIHRVQNMKLWKLFAMHYENMRERWRHEPNLELVNGGLPSLWHGTRHTEPHKVCTTEQGMQRCCCCRHVQIALPKSGCNR